MYNVYIHTHIYICIMCIRRPLPSLGLGGAWDHRRCAKWAVAPPVPALAANFSCRRPSRAAMGPAKLFLSAFDTAMWHVLGTL